MTTQMKLFTDGDFEAMYLRLRNEDGMMAVLSRMQASHGIHERKAYENADAMIRLVAAHENAANMLSDDAMAVLDAFLNESAFMGGYTRKVFLHQMYFGLKMYQDEALIEKIKEGAAESVLFHEYYTRCGEDPSITEAMLEAEVRKMMGNYRVSPEAMRYIVKQMEQKNQNDHRGGSGQIALIQPKREAVKDGCQKPAAPVFKEHINAQQAQQQRQRIDVRPREIGCIGERHGFIGCEHTADQRDVKRLFYLHQVHDQQCACRQKRCGKQADGQRRGDVSADLPIDRLKEAPKRGLVCFFADLCKEHGITREAKRQIPVSMRQKGKDSRIQQHAANDVLGDFFLHINPLSVGRSSFNSFIIHSVCPFVDGKLPGIGTQNGWTDRQIKGDVQRFSKEKQPAFAGR